MKPPLPAVLYGTGLVLTFGAGWFFKPASVPVDPASPAASHATFPAKPPGPPIPQKAADTAAAYRENWLEAVSENVAAIRAASQPGVVNQVLLEKLKAALHLTDKLQRQASWQGLMTEMRPEDALAVLEIFGGLDKEGRWATEELRSFLQRWGGIDGPAALSGLEKIPRRSISDDQISEVMTGWAQHHSGSALEWLMAQDRTTANYRLAFAGVFEGLATADLKAAESLLLTNTGDAAARELFSRIASHRVRREGTAAAAAWFDQLAGKTVPDYYKKENLNALTQYIQRQNSMHGNITTGLMNLLPAYAHEPWLPENAGMALGIEWAGSDPAAGIKELDQMTSAEAQEAALRVLLYNWEADSLGQWLNANRVHRFFDRAAEALVRGIHDSDPEAAKAWAAQIKDPRLRQKTEKLFLPPPDDPFAAGQ